MDFYGKCCKMNDRTSMTLDLKERTISLAVNGEDQGIAFRDIPKSKNIKYRLFVSLHGKNDSVEISNYSITK